MAHSVDLHNAIPDVCRAKPYWVIGKGHNNLDYNFDPLVLKLIQFLEEYLGEYVVKKKRSKISPAKIIKVKALGMNPHRVQHVLPENE